MGFLPIGNSLVFWTSASAVIGARALEIGLVGRPNRAMGSTALIMIGRERRRLKFLPTVKLWPAAV
jgi:hypothetical protein